MPEAAASFPKSHADLEIRLFFRVDRSKRDDTGQSGRLEL